MALSTCRDTEQTPYLPLTKPYSQAQKLYLFSTHDNLSTSFMQSICFNFTYYCSCTFEFEPKANLKALLNVRKWAMKPGVYSSNSAINSSCFCKQFSQCREEKKSGSNDSVNRCEIYVVNFYLSHKLTMPLITATLILIHYKRHLMSINLHFVESALSLVTD